MIPILPLIEKLQILSGKSVGSQSRVSIFLFQISEEEFSCFKETMLKGNAAYIKDEISASIKQNETETPMPSSLVYLFGLTSVI